MARVSDAEENANFAKTGLLRLKGSEQLSFL